MPTACVNLPRIHNSECVDKLTFTNVSCIFAMYRLVKTSLQIH